MDYIEATQAIPLSDYEDETDDESQEHDGQSKKIVARLQVLGQKGFPETEFPVYEGKNVIGRQEGSDIAIPLKALSKEHACIEVISGSHIIYDKGSRNKTRRLKLYLSPEVRYELRDGDSLTFGDIKCVYQYGPPPPPQQEADNGSETGSEAGSESMLPDTEQRVQDNDPEGPEVSEPSSDLIEPTQGRSSPIKTNKSRLAPEATFMYATDSEDEDDGGKADGLFPSVTETPLHKDDATMVVAESGSESDIFSDRKADDEAVQSFLNESDLSVENDRRTSQEKKSRSAKSGDVAPTQAYTLQPEDDPGEGTSTSAAKTTGAVGPTQAYTLEPEDLEAGKEPAKSQKNAKSAKAAKVQQKTKVKKVVEQTVAYTMDVEDNTEDKAKQKKVSETVAYNMEPEDDDETDDEGTVKNKDETNAETEETQTFSTDAEAETSDAKHSPILNLGNTLAFDDDFDDDMDAEMLAIKEVPRQETGTFAVGEDGDYDLPTQVFPEEGTVPVSDPQAETQVFDGEATDDQSTQDLMDEGADPEKTRHLKKTPATADDQATQMFEEADATQPVVTEIAETQVLDEPCSPSSPAVTLHLEATQVFSDEDTPTVVVSKSPSPKKKVQWAMEATQVFGDEMDGDDTEDESDSIDQKQVAASRQKGSRAGARAKTSPRNLDDTQVLDDTCPVITVDTTPSPSGKSKAKSNTSPRFELAATQVFTDEGPECEATQMIDDACPTIELEDTPFRKPTKKPARASDVCPATEVFNDDATNCDETQVLDDTCPTLEFDETPFRKPSKKVTCASDVFPATPLYKDDIGDCDATQMLDENCPTVEIDETPFRTPTKRPPRTSDVCSATQVFTSEVKNCDATQIFGATPTLELDDLESSVKRPRRRTKEVSPCAATQVFEADSTQILSDDEIDQVAMGTESACPTLELDETPDHKPKKKTAGEPDLMAATQVLSNIEETQMLDDVCPTIELDQTPLHKPTKRPARASDLCPATQVFNDDALNCDATQMLDDQDPTLEVEQQSPKKKARRSVKMASPGAATQVFGDDETQPLSDDDYATQQLEDPETADAEPDQSGKGKNKATSESDVKDGALTAGGANDASDQETQGYAEEDPSESAAPRLETFVHPDEAATQAYGDPGLDSESEVESSQEVDFGLPIGQQAHKSPGKGGDDSAAKGVTAETGPDHPVETEEVGEPDEDTPETSEGKPGDEEATQAYMLYDDEEDEEDEGNNEESLPDIPKNGKAASTFVSPPPADDSVLLIEEATPPALPPAKGQKAGKAKTTKSTAATHKADHKPTGAKEDKLEETTKKNQRKEKGALKEEENVKDEQGKRGKGGRRHVRAEPEETNTEDAVADAPKQGTNKKDTNQPGKSATKDELSVHTEEAVTEEAAVPRRRGRPRKSDVPVESVTNKEEHAAEEPRQRGRPRKSDVQPEKTATQGSQETCSPRRGRPRKSDVGKQSASVKMGKEAEEKEEKEGENKQEKNEDQPQGIIEENRVVRSRRSGHRGKASDERAQETALPTIQENSGNHTAGNKKSQITETHTEPEESDRRKSSRAALAKGRATSRGKQVEEEDSAKTDADSQEGSQSSRGRRSTLKTKTEETKSESSPAKKDTKSKAASRTGRHARSDQSDGATNLDVESSRPTAAKRKSDCQSTDEEMPPLEPRGRHLKRRRGEACDDDTESVASEASTLKDLDTASTETAGKVEKDSASQDPKTGKTEATRSSRRSRATTSQPSEDTQKSHSRSPVRSARGRRGQKDEDAASEVSVKASSTESKQAPTGRKKKEEESEEKEDSQSSESQEGGRRGRRGQGKVDYAALAAGGRTNRKSLPQKAADPPPPPAKTTRGNVQHHEEERVDIKEKSVKAGKGGSKQCEQKGPPEDKQETEHSTEAEMEDVVSESSQGSRREVATGKARGARGKRSKADETDSVPGSPPKKQTTARQSRISGVKGAKAEKESEPEPVSVEEVKAKPGRVSRRTEQKLHGVEDTLEEETASKPVSRRGRSQGTLQVKTEKEDDSVSVASEEGSSQQSTGGKAGRGRRKTTQVIVTVPPKRDTSGDALVRGSRRGQAKVKVEEQTVDPPANEVVQPRRGRGRTSKVTAVDEEVDQGAKAGSTLRKSNSQGSLGGSQRGRRGNKEEADDEFVSLSASKQTVKREASTDSQTSSASSQPAPKKRRGAAEKAIPPASPTRSQRSHSQPSAPSTPTLRHRSDKPKIMFTGLVDSAGQKARTIKDLGGELADSMFDCTHLVTDKVRRTVKLLCGVARGVPVVTTRWLEACRKAQAFVDSTPFLVKDAESEKTHGFHLGPSLTRAEDTPMLQGLRVHVTKSVKPDPKQMQEIIKCAGGEFVSSLPRGASSQAAGADLVVVSCDEDVSSIRAALPEQAHVVTSEFLLTGILRQVVDFKAHQLAVGPSETKRRKR